MYIHKLTYIHTHIHVHVHGFFSHRRCSLCACARQTTAAVAAVDRKNIFCALVVATALAMPLRIANVANSCNQLANADK